MEYMDLYRKYELSTIEDELGVVFEDKELLTRAMVHSSFNSENNENYQRLEFLGDAVIQMVVSDYLYRHYPEMKEGEMSKMRSALVSAPSFCLIVKNLKFHTKIISGKSMGTTDVKVSDSVIADIYESIIGAIYLDKGYNIVKKIILQTVIEQKETLLKQEAIKDFKTKLQEELQVNGNITIVYETNKKDEQFNSHLLVEGVNIGCGLGATKKEAEQRAAKDALEKRK